MTRLASTLLLYVLLINQEAMAEDSSGERFIELAIGHGADHNLQELPGEIVAGSINWDATHYVGIYSGKQFSSLGNTFPFLANTLLSGVQQGYTLSVLKHSGLQDNLEAAAAYTLTTPALRLGPIATNLSVGAGFSYAFSRPSYEDGPIGTPDRRYRGQFCLLIENEWRLRQHEQWRLVFRVHHRSGVYGVIAPRNVGSNFLGLGIRRVF